jgi:hypothetical protein
MALLSLEDSFMNTEVTQTAAITRNRRDDPSPGRTLLDRNFSSRSMLRNNRMPIEKMLKQSLDCSPARMRHECFENSHRCCPVPYRRNCDAFASCFDRRGQRRSLPGLPKSTWLCVGKDSKRFSQCRLHGNESAELLKTSSKLLHNWRTLIEN